MQPSLLKDLRSADFEAQKKNGANTISAPFHVP
jgi:hypothetical protein